MIAQIVIPQHVISRIDEEHLGPFENLERRGQFCCRSNQNIARTRVDWQDYRSKTTCRHIA
jgi:hypothetical protein